MSGTQGMAWNREINPGRCWPIGEGLGLAKRQAGCPIAQSKQPMQRGKGKRCAVKNRDRHPCGNLLPGPPMVEGCKVIRSHQPNEFMTCKPALQKPDRLHRVAQPVTFFEPKYVQSRVLRHGLRQRKTQFVISQILGLFEGVLRRDQPPDFIEIEPLQRFERDMQMARMGRIERAAEKTDPPSLFFLLSPCARAGEFLRAVRGIRRVDTSPYASRGALRACVLPLSRKGRARKGPIMHASRHQAFWW